MIMFNCKRNFLFILMFFLAPAVSSAYVEKKVDLSSYQRANVYVTLYGSPDNSPPGGNIAYPVIHKKAGGVGTYTDPVTFAVGRGFMKPGTIIYYPTLRKYFIMEDLCVGCGRNHIDLWAGYGTRRGGILQCEEKLTRQNAQIVTSPGSTLPVDTTPIWDENTKKCQTPFE